MIKGVVNGESANSVMISYSHNPLFNAMYDFNEEEGRYERFSDGEQTIDYESKDPCFSRKSFHRGNSPFRLWMMQEDGTLTLNQAVMLT